jgi:Carboxypeptidase regulatory-like domain
MKSTFRVKLSSFAQRYLSRLTPITVLTLVVLAFVTAAQAQVTTGNVRGIVSDPNGAAVPNAKVTITKKSTNISTTTQTTGTGEYQFSNLLAGDDYNITIEAQNFKTLTLSDVKVQLNQTTDLPAQLALGGIGETVTVTAGGAELVDTTTQNLSKSFTDRQVVELAQSSTGLGVYNLALIAPNVSSTGGVGVGSGGSVGGQRPRNNNFVVDGIDNNDKAVTGPQVYISPETVGEFTLLSNQYSAEFARSTGGQFIIATKSGSNEFHGTAYFFGRNRKLNAIDALNKQPGSAFVRDPSQADPANGITRQPRSDYFRTGGNVGGPIIKNKLFFFTSYERIGRGDAAGTQFIAPTSAGYTALSGIAGLSANNLGLLKTFIPAAATGTDTLFVCPNLTGAACKLGAAGAVSIPVGSISLPAPNFFNRKNLLINLDYTQSSTTQHRWRFVKNDEGLIDTAATLPQFYLLLPTKQYLFSYTLLHTFTPALSNETRLSFRRSNAPVPVPSIAFPLAGFDQFPNVTVDEFGANIGPDPNAPQFTIENNYQVIDNVTWVRGNHSFKFGGDFRKLISPQSFVQRQRGDYEWGTLNNFLHDVAPDFGERNVGANTYYGDQRLFFAFAQDDWRFRPNLTLNLGLNYAYQEVPFGARQQNLNSISSVPGVLEFNSPKAQKKNFAPRVGFAWSPNYDNSTLMGRLFGNQGKTSIRAGFSMAYDVIFDNIYILSSPPQFQQTKDVTGNETNFLAGGGIPNIIAPTGNDPVAARAATSTFIPDQQVPYSLTYTASIQRQFKQDWSIELRYLGTRGVHLLTQNRINIQDKVLDTPGGFLPTFFSSPSQSQIDSTPLDLASIEARSNLVPKYANAGFTNAVVGFLSDGNSTYHGGSASLTHRFTKGYQMSAAYTYSHLIDDTTAEVFSTILSPRRVEDFQNLRRERADSALDHRHRFVISSLYEMSYFNKNEHYLVRKILGGFNFAGTLTFESGEKATVRSGIDSNLNGDNAGDRSIINVGGAAKTFSTVTPLLRTCIGPLNPDGSCQQSDASRTVGYLATNPNAQYVQAGLGALSNGGRNTLQLPGIRNLDLSVFKNFHITEGKFFQLRLDMFNAFNHPQFTPGSVNGAELTSITSGPASNINNINALSSGVVNRPDLVYSSHPRLIQIAARFNF